MTKDKLPRSFYVKAFIISTICFPIGVWAQSASDNVMTISQKSRTYAPAAVTIKAGETLRIVNDDIFLHHAFVDSENLKYDSGSMEEGETRDITFKTRGEYQVKCAIHPRMNLNVTVN